MSSERQFKKEQRNYYYYWLKYEYYIAELKYLAKNILESKENHSLLDEIKILICSHFKNITNYAITILQFD